MCFTSPNTVYYNSLHKCFLQPFVVVVVVVVVVVFFVGFHNDEKKQQQEKGSIP